MEVLYQLSYPGEQTFQSESLFTAIDVRRFATIEEASSHEPDWPTRAAATIRAVLLFAEDLASEPEFAKLICVDVYAAGPWALERRDQAIEPPSASSKTASRTTHQS
jgi:hypothetical protein